MRVERGQNRATVPLKNQGIAMDNKPDENAKDEKTKFSQTLENLKSNEKIEDLYNYATTNTKDTIAYVAMILGILILLFHPFYGGGLIGIVAGLYFSQEIMVPVRSFEKFIDNQGMVRCLILAGALLGLFIEAPAIFIGAAVAVALKELVMPEN